MPEISRDSRSAFRITATAFAALFSVVLHGAVIAAVVSWLDPTPGAIPVQTDAISLELSQTDVTEAVEITASQDAEASFASVQTEIGAAEEAPAAEGTPDELKPQKPEDVEATQEEPDTLDVAEVTPQGVEVLDGSIEVEERTGQDSEDAEKPKPARAKPEPRTRPKPKRPKTDTSNARPKPETAQKMKSTPREKGGAKSRAAKGSAASSGRVSASSGSAINYAARVRARVASRKPSGGGRRGTVVISFGVSRSGSLSYARIARSSGDPGLDRSVLAAVRGAGPFPTPPPGAGLQFSIPFYFR